MSEINLSQVLNNIRIVLVGTSHAGNIGSAARAMKTMGLTDLRLVEPCTYSAEQGDAFALASGANDIVAAAHNVTDLTMAISECTLVIGSSARLRTMPWPLMSPQAAAKILVDTAVKSPVALVFGRERAGLTNQELAHCQYHACIDANPDYSSLNLAMAVQVFAYQIRCTALQQGNSLDDIVDSIEKAVTGDKPATAGELNFLFQRLESVLDKADFLYQQDPQYMLRKLKRVVYKAQLEHKEINIIQGIFTAIENKIKNLKNSADN